MLLIAPTLPVPHAGDPTQPGWAAFNHWDSKAYEHIATKGYQFKDNGKGYNVAFFPLYPLLARSLMSLGLSFNAAGTIINNLAFLAALVVLYLWMQERYGRNPARWATAALAWSPFSIFGAVAYTEGLFLLCSTSSLRAFDRHQYGWAAFWGFLTTAARPPGVAIVATFWLVSWLEKRGIIAYLTGLISSGGLLLYMLYCNWRFGQPIAFVLAQRGWYPKQEFHGAVWIDLFETVLFGAANEDKGRLVDPWYPLALLVILGIGLALWFKRHPLGFPRTGYGLLFLAVLLWLVGGAPLITVVMVFGGAFLIWRSRHQLCRTALVYGGFSWLIILGVGRTISTDRFSFACITLWMAVGLLLSRYPRWGYATLIFCGVLLASFAVRFAQELWVA